MSECNSKRSAENHDAVGYIIKAESRMVRDSAFSVRLLRTYLRLPTLGCSFLTCPRLGREPAQPSATKMPIIAAASRHLLVIGGSLMRGHLLHSTRTFPRCVLHERTLMEEKRKRHTELLRNS